MRAWFLNLGPSSTTSAEANADIRAMAQRKPELILGCESIGKRLDKLDGYELIRDTSNEGRANLFAYVKDENVVYEWTDCHIRFPRLLHPHLGLHPPRSILRFPYRGAQVIVAHKPPEWPGAGPSRTEHDQRLARMMAPWLDEQRWTRRPQEKRTEAKARPRLLFWDCNGMEGAEVLAGRTSGRLVGEHIDNAIIRNVKLTDRPSYRQGVRGHRFATDHKFGAFNLGFKLG